ncbi:MAG: hypothetical protein LBN32_01425 [Helicobacteraceae bacterium]|jgi:predicted DNA repair protein MutK|nr:hypothetical protein [Helicobacteraceae bacterium]
MPRKKSVTNTIESIRKHAAFEAISDWAWSNAASVIAIAIASALSGIVGFVAGMALFAFINYYKQSK